MLIRSLKMMNCVSVFVEPRVKIGSTRTERLVNASTGHVSSHAHHALEALLRKMTSCKVLNLNAHAIPPMEKTHATQYMVGFGSIDSMEKNALLKRKLLMTLKEKLINKATIFRKIHLKPSRLVTLEPSQLLPLD